MKVVWLADFSVHLKVRLVQAPYRGINKLPAEPVVMIFCGSKSRGRGYIRGGCRGPGGRAKHQNWWSETAVPQDIVLFHRLFHKMCKTQRNTRISWRKSGKTGHGETGGSKPGTIENTGLSGFLFVF